MAEHELGPLVAGEDLLALRDRGERLEVLLARAPGVNSNSMDAGCSDSLRNPWMPPGGTYRNSPSVALAHWDPLKSRIVPDRMKNDSEIVLWKCASGPLRFAPKSHRYRPNSPPVDAAVAR